MEVTALYFASIREKTGVETDSLNLPDGSTVGEAWEKIDSKYGLGGAAFLESLRFAVNLSFVGKDAVLKNGDELALIPPVSGG